MQVILQHFDKRVTENGFIQDPDIFKAEGKIDINWTRRKQWKEEVIEFLYPKDCTYFMPQTHINLLMNERIYDHYKGTTFGSINKKNSEYYLPKTNIGFLQNILLNRLLGTLDKDISNAIKWLEKYDDPQICLDDILDRERELSMYKNINVSFTKVEAFLESIIQTKNDKNCDNTNP